MLSYQKQKETQLEESKCISETLWNIIEYENYIYLAGMEMSMTCSVITEKVV